METPSSCAVTMIAIPRALLGLRCLCEVACIVMLDTEGTSLLVASHAITNNNGKHI